MSASFKTEALRTVMEDLAYVTKEWKKDIDDNVLRRDCAVLRRLLIQDDLGKAWRAVEFQGQPQILSPVLDIAGDKKRVFFAQAGGAHYKGMEVSVEMYYGDVPKEVGRGTGTEDSGMVLEDEARFGPRVARLWVKQASEKPAKTLLSLSKFLASTCIIVNGTEISRRELILYVANTLGGAHLDWARVPKPNMKAKFEALDAHYKTGETAGKESIYYELLSIGQSLANSQDIPKLIKQIKQVIDRH